MTTREEFSKTPPQVRFRFLVVCHSVRPSMRELSNSGGFKQESADLRRSVSAPFPIVSTRCGAVSKLETNERNRRCSRPLARHYYGGDKTEASTHLDEDNVATSVGVSHEASRGEQLPLVLRQKQPLQRVVIRVPCVNHRKNRQRSGMGAFG